MKPRIALIGAGNFGRNHLRVLRELEDLDLCELAGVADLTPENLRFAYRNYRLLTCRDYHKLLNDGVDAVDIVTPASTHHKICMDSLEAGKHVFVEKPLATSYYDAQQIVASAKAENKTLMVGHIFRYNFAVRKIRELINKGVLGEIHYLYGHFMGLKTPKPDVGALANYAVHHIDIYNYLLDETPREVTCHLSYPLGRPLEDVAWLALKYDGASAFVEGSWLPPGKRRDLTVVGSRKSVISDLLEQTVEIHHSHLDDELRAVDGGFEKGTLPFDQKFKEPLKLELQSFVDAINNGKQPLSNGDTALSVVETIEKAYVSARLGKTVKLHD